MTSRPVPMPGASDCEKGSITDTWTQQAGYHLFLTILVHKSEDHAKTTGTERDDGSGRTLPRFSLPVTCFGTTLSSQKMSFYSFERERERERDILAQAVSGSSPWGALCEPIFSPFFSAPHRDNRSVPCTPLFFLFCRIAVHQEGEPCVLPCRGPDRRDRKGRS